MCGICGIIRFDNKQVMEEPIRMMMQEMKHRGPDDEGVFIENNVGFGFVRLNIIDLTFAGHQPKLSQNERYVIVFNGEIYNYLELREELQEEGVKFFSETDTEVLLNAYIQWGEECMHRFNGMWAFAIFDREKKIIFCARDRFGIKPFYYLQTKEFFALASEITPLLKLLPSKPTPDNQSIFDFLVFNRTDQTERTFFTEIKKLQHGHKFGIDLNFPPVGGIQGGIKWYDLRERVSKATGFKSPFEYKELFTSAINLHLRSDVPVGVCLSGGLDSSSITSMLFQKFKNRDLNTFSAVYNEGQTGDETVFINEFKSSLRNMYFTTPDEETLSADLEQFVKIHGEPVPGTSPYAQFKVMELAKGKVVVTLDGQGADEQLAGYHDFFSYYFKDLLLQHKFRRLLYEIFWYFNNHRSIFGLKALFFFLLSKDAKTNLRIIEKPYLKHEFIRKYKDTNTVSGNQYASNSLKDALLDHFEFKLEHLLKWEDHNSMWFSIEARVPFLDYRLVEKTLATSSQLIIKKGVTKFILREAMKGVVCEKIRLRKDKVGFSTPQDEWFRTEEWQKYITDLLTSASFKERNFIDSNIALKEYQAHLKGNVNIAKEIWKWVNLELWFRIFIDVPNQTS
jgi:asparagine synthase (glutamine-hydrolysing)